MELYTTVEDYKKLKKSSAEIFLEFLNEVKHEYMLCIDEVFSNSCIHAYKGEKGKLIVKYLIESSYLILKIRDFGVGIDKECIELDNELDPLVTCGRGLYILDNFSNKCLISKCDLGGTEVTLYFER